MWVADVVSNSTAALGIRLHFKDVICRPGAHLAGLRTQ